MWALAYDIPINLSTKDFSPDFEHSIVTSVDTSDDGMTFTYHFRPGVKWSDGEPFTAEDAAWTFTYYKENNVPNYSADLALMDTAVATDDTTMVLTSTSPRRSTRASPCSSTTTSCPSTSGSKFEDDYKGAKQEPGFPSVGTGPYIITNYVKNQFVQLDRNPNYWGNDNRHAPAHRPDHLPHLRQPGRRGRRPSVRRGRFRHFTSANILNTLASRGLETRGAHRPQLRRDRHQHRLGVPDRSRRRLQAAR